MTAHNIYISIRKQPITHTNSQPDTFNMNQLLSAAVFATIAATSAFASVVTYVLSPFSSFIHALIVS